MGYVRKRDGGAAGARKKLNAAGVWKKSSIWKWAGAVVAVVVAVGVAVWWMGRGEDKRSDQGERRVEGNAPYQAVENGALGTMRPTTAEPTGRDEAEARGMTKRERDLKQLRDLYGDDVPDNLKPVVYFLEHPPQKVYKVKGRHDFLRHPSERRIAGVALVEPGTYFVVKPEFDESFDADFANALVDRIEVEDGDGDDVKAAKEAVEALKHDIADICRSEGRTPSEVMNEHAAAMYELGRYQRDLEAELERIQDDADLTDAEVEEFCVAANKLLEAKGVAPIRIPDLTRRSMRLRRNRRMAERKAAKEARK